MIPASNYTKFLFCIVSYAADSADKAAPFGCRLVADLRHAASAHGKYTK